MTTVRSLLLTHTLRIPTTWWAFSSQCTLIIHRCPPYIITSCFHHLSIQQMHLLLCIHCSIHLPHMQYIASPPQPQLSHSSQWTHPKQHLQDRRWICLMFYYKNQPSHMHTRRTPYQVYTHPTYGLDSLRAVSPTHPTVMCTNGSVEHLECMR